MKVLKYMGSHNRAGVVRGKQRFETMVPDHEDFVSYVSWAMITITMEMMTYLRLFHSSTVGVTNVDLPVDKGVGDT
jgi:hypothetical protein